MEQLVLKKLVNHKNKNIVIGLGTLLFAVLYLTSGHISYASGMILRMPAWEESIPFIQSTIWIYIVYYPFYLIWALRNYKDESNMNKFLYSFILLTVISCIFFVLLPISYPREYYPLGFGNDLTTKIFRIMRSMDRPSNCFPSLHVGLCFIFAFHMKNESKAKFIFSIFSSLLIAVSTLTTKQHYIFDICGGFILALIIYIFFQKCIGISQDQTKEKSRDPEGNFQ